MAILSDLVGFTLTVTIRYTTIHNNWSRFKFSLSFNLDIPRYKYSSIFSHTFLYTSNKQTRLAACVGALWCANSLPHSLIICSHWLAASRNQCLHWKRKTPFVLIWLALSAGSFGLHQTVFATCLPIPSMLILTCSAWFVKQILLLLMYLMLFAVSTGLKAWPVFLRSMIILSFLPKLGRSS